MNYLKKLTIKKVAAVVGVIEFIDYLSIALKFNWLDAIVNFPKGLIRFTELYLPPDVTELPEMLKEMWNTIVIAIAGAFVGMVLGFFGAISISKKTGRNKVLNVIIRFIASFTRNIPEGVWAIILLIAFWFGEFLAFIVICIISFGFLTRVYADSIDESSASSIEALEATGASFWQIVYCAIIPEVMPSLVSWGLYTAENNIRSSTIIGMLTGSGIGYLITMYKDFRKFQSLSVAIFLVVVVIIVFDQFTDYIRRRIIE